MASHFNRRRAGAAAAVYWIGLLAFSTAPAGAVAGQMEPTAEEVALAGAVRERFEVDLRPDGLALTSTGAGGAARVITLGDGVVAVDGVPVSGLELRRAFGDDADLVLRVTYLGDAARQALFGGDGDNAADPPGPEEADASADGEVSGAVEQSAETQPVEDVPAGAEPAATQPGVAELTADEETAAAAPRAEASAAAGRATADPGAGSAGRSDGAPEVPTTIRGDVFRLGGPVTIESDERVRGDATVILGPLSVDGEVTGDVVVIAGGARFGPEAVVRGDITVVGGTLREAPTAALRGAVTHVGIGDLNPFRASGPFTGFNGWRFGPWPLGWRGGGNDLVGTAMRLLLLALLACGIVLVAQGPVERIARRASAEPLKAGVVGVLAQMLAVPLLVSGILMAVISIVGIPLLLLLPFVVMAAGLIMLVGFSGAVLGAGELVRNRMGASSSAAYASVWAGVALILLPTMAGEALGIAGGLFRGLGVLLALLGLLLEYAAWTAGLGAFILNRFSSLPPAPAPAPPVALPPAPGIAAPDADRDER